MIQNFPRRARSTRRGAAFLLLVIAVLLVVTGATFEMIRSESMLRRAQSDAQRAGTMRRAIEAVARASDSTTEVVRLPLDENQWIEVRTETNNDGNQMVATWFRNENLIDTLKQKMNHD